MRRLLPFVAVSALLALGALLVTPHASTEDKPAKIGVIDLNRVFGQYKRVKEFEEKLDQEQMDEAEYLTRMWKEWKELSSMPVRAEWRKEMEAKYVSLQALMKFRLEDWGRRAEDARNAHTARIFNEICEEAAAYARENGFTFIVESATGPLDEKDATSARRRIARHPVLYCAEGSDLTDEVARRLNAK